MVIVPGRSPPSSPPRASSSPVHPNWPPRLPRDHYLCTSGLVRGPRTARPTTRVHLTRPFTIKSPKAKQPRSPRHRRNVDAKKRNINVLIARSCSIDRSASESTSTHIRVINVRRGILSILSPSLFLFSSDAEFPALIQPIHVHSLTVRDNST